MYLILSVLVFSVYNYSVFIIILLRKIAHLEKVDIKKLF